MIVNRSWVLSPPKKPRPERPSLLKIVSDPWKKAHFQSGWIGRRGGRSCSQTLRRQEAGINPRTTATSETTNRPMRDTT